MNKVVHLESCIIDLPPKSFRHILYAMKVNALSTGVERIQVHKWLLNVVLPDPLPEHNAEKPRIAAIA